MDVSHQRAERFYVKLSLGGLLGLVLLIGLIWTGRHFYAQWQEKRLVGIAQRSIEGGDEKTASVAARSVLQLKPTSTGAARIIAQLGERANDPIALDWWGKVAAAKDHSIEDLLAWARCALHFNNTAMAERALSQMPHEGRELASYHAIAALIAQEHHDTHAAETEWKAAVRLAPTENSYALQLGSLLLQSADAQRREAGARLLNGLGNDPKQRVPATRALITDLISHHGNAPAIVELARALQAYPEAASQDRLVYLDLLHQVDPNAFSSYLSELETRSLTQPIDLAELLNWMSRNNLNVLAADYLKTVPANQLDKWPVPLAVADVYVRLKEWRKLEASTKSSGWRESEYLREAYLARALREQNKLVGAEHEWAAAIKAASARPEATLALARTVSDWGWDKEALEVLWELSKNAEKRTEALQTLYRYYARHGDTQGLFKVLVRLNENDPTNLDVQNNLAQISLLLNAQPEEGRRLAAEIYQKKPTNAAYATTYAYSLLTKGQIAQAVKIMNSLSEQQLRDPAVSAYYGICLAAAKDPRAYEFLEIGKSAPLLPEEKALIEKALGHIQP
jgi:predicted Zn-dependent protease